MFARLARTLLLSLLATAPLAAAQPFIDPDKGGDGGLTSGVWSADPVLGSLDAPVTIVEYASWTCPHCAAFHVQVLDPIIKPLAEQGVVRFVARDLLRNWIDLRLAQATRCEGVDFFAASDALFTDQQSYLVNDPATVNRVAAEKLGLEPSDLETCLSDATMGEWLVQRTVEANQLGVNSTPSVFVNGTRFDLRDLANFESHIRELAVQISGDERFAAPQ